MQTMVYLMVHHSMYVCARVFAASNSFARTSAKALTMQECSVKKASSGTLVGKSWNQFRK